MSRYTKQIDEHISIAYGFDKPLQGYFIQVYDDRLQWDKDKTEEENEAAEKADPTGEGMIKDYASNEILTYTGNVRSNSEIVELLEDFNVEEAHIHSVAMDLPF